MMRYRFFFLLLSFIVPFQADCQTLPTIAEKTKTMIPYSGFQNFYWEESSGKIWLLIDKFDQEFLYQTSLSAGLGSNDIGLDRGKLGNTFIVKFKKVGNKVLMVQPNYAYRALSSDLAEKKAVEESFAQSVLWGFTIDAETNSAVLVDASSFLMRDALKIAAVLKKANQGSYAIDESRTAMYLERTKSFPLNVEFETTVSFVSREGATGGYVREVTPDAASISLRVHHSFVQLPDDKFETRLYDPRSPYITNSYFDYSTPIAEPIQKDFIIRHRLQKKNPAAAKSEAIKPIIYYLDAGTPEPIRSALLDGARWWNQAFESAGFINAFQVKLLPADADPMDLRYNMINWVHRSTRGWSYGDAVVDPRTGEILKGNVSLGSLRVRQDYLIAQGLLAPFTNDSIRTDSRMLQMATQRLKQLAAHEIGHTIGLMHNYIASAQNNASVMDYPAPYVLLDKNGEIDLKEAYTNEIGEWDKISIQYGYTEFPTGTNEAAALDKLLTDALKNGLSFISDRDARDAGGLHPNAHLWDAGTDAVTELKRVMGVRKTALSKFGENNIRKGTPMAMLEDVLVPIYLLHRYQVEAATKVIGGQFYSYAVKGDGQTVTKTVSRLEQLTALQAIADCMSPETLAIDERIIKLIPPRPAGYSYTRELFNRKTGLAFDPLAAAEAAADIPLSFLFNTSRLNRMAEYKATNEGLGITEMINVLISKFFVAQPSKGLRGLIELQNQQLLLTYLLSVSLNDDASFATKAAMFSAIDNLKKTAISKLSTSKDNIEKGYLLLMLERIEFPEKAKATMPIAAPPGSPIGCGMGENETIEKQN
jgi:hypothetical protein